MVLNKQKGNMYPDVTHTWNAIKGKCPYECSYCYMKDKPVGELRLDEKCFKDNKDNLGENNFIFVGSSVDMFAEQIPRKWIIKVLNYCSKFPENKYLFQTKNPKRFKELIPFFPKNTILGTTIESDLGFPTISKAIHPHNRAFGLAIIEEFEKMVSIEPIMEFELKELITLIEMINPKFVSIGADSKNHNLPEPSKEKIEELIKKLNEFTEVKIKDNLKRLL